MTMNGVLLIDKVAGNSSAQEISRIKRKFKIIDKIGHAGTLDPFATGLLVVLLGKATRLADYFQSGNKTYSGEIRLGLSTVSDDITGEIISENSKIVEFAEVEKVALSMLGTHAQLPPRISAINIAGKRAYQLVRNGQEFELAPRTVSMYAVEVWQVSDSVIAFRLNCSKGFYVRAFARDLGKMLGCGACLQSLRREQSLPFNLGKAHLAEKATLEDILPWDAALSFLVKQELAVEDQEFAALKNGLVPYSVSTKLQSEFKSAPKLDSDTKDLLVYRRQSDGVAGGLLSKDGLEFKIAVNM